MDLSLLLSSILTTAKDNTVVAAMLSSSALLHPADDNNNKATQPPHFRPALPALHNQIAALDADTTASMVHAAIATRASHAGIASARAMGPCLSAYSPHALLAAAASVESSAACAHSLLQCLCSFPVVDAVLAGGGAAHRQTDKARKGVPRAMASVSDEDDGVAASDIAADSEEDTMTAIAGGALASAAAVETRKCTFTILLTDMFFVLLES